MEWFPDPSVAWGWGASWRTAVFLSA